MTRRGMTLVEMLVAMTATLVLMAAVAQAFAVFGTAITGSRALLDVDARMRTVAWRLRSDLAGATARPLPPLSPDSAEGYLEIIEGFATDVTNSAGASSIGLPLSGDHDDALLFTVRNAETPFIGRAPTDAKGDASVLVDSFESTLAEVAWFARRTPGSMNPVTYTLYRRQLLVMGYVGTFPFHNVVGSGNSLSWANAGNSWATFYNWPCDVSVRREGAMLFSNTLGDLTKRENRFMHNFDGITVVEGFPFLFVNHQQPSTASDREVLPKDIEGLIFDANSPRQGEDVVLTNVLAFDVRVFDPAVPVAISADGATPIVPGDSTYSSSAAAGSGAYVDLGYTEKGVVVRNGLLTPALGAMNAGHFSGVPQRRSQLDFDKTRNVYDTWSTHYEANGRDEDADPPAPAKARLGDVLGPDQGRNGIDDDSDGKIDEPPFDANGNGLYTDAGDDPGEFETSPPYPYPLRGIEVRIRCYEPSSRQVRQVTVRHTFVPH